MAYVWDVVPTRGARTSATSTQCVVDLRTDQLRVSTFEPPLHLGAAVHDTGAAGRSVTTRVTLEELRRIGVPDPLLVTLLAARTPAELEHLRVTMPQHPTTYIAHMIQSCEIYIPFFSAFLRARGTDDLAYCLENSLSRANVYSQSRASNIRPISWSESVVEPAGWSTTAVREVWYQNMYNSPP